MVLGVPLALLGAQATRFNAASRTAGEGRFERRLLCQQPPGRIAHVGTIEIEPKHGERWSLYSKMAEADCALARSDRPTSFREPTPRHSELPSAGLNPLVAVLREDADIGGHRHHECACNDDRPADTRPAWLVDAGTQWRATREPESIKRSPKNIRDDSAVLVRDRP